MPSLSTLIQIGRTFGAHDGLLRLNYELRRSTGLMLRRMNSVNGWTAWTLDCIASGTNSAALLQSRWEGKHPFFFPDAPALASSIAGIVGETGRAQLLEEADHILSGQLPYFGSLSFSCGFPPRWFENPDTRQKVPPQQPWTRLRFASPAHGDLKFILEPSRFLFGYTLARAYVVTADERFANAFWTAVEDWAAQSPPMTGPLWICGQECSLRILAWSFAFHAFLHSPATTPERASLLLSMIAAHAWRTEQTLNYARSQRSNHLVTEAVGLFTAATLFPELKHAPRWQRLGAHLLREAVLDQITPEGVSQQHSFNYQRMILHLLLWTLRLADIHNFAIDSEIRSRTIAAFEFLRSFVDPLTGRAPNHGSNDGSLVLPLAACDYADFRPLVQLGAAVLDRPGLAPGPWDESAVWLCGTAPARVQAATAPRIDSETGYHFLGDQHSWALIKASRYTRRPFQADQLHLDLWYRGLNIARDPGTYLYNGESPWDNGLACSIVHNTVTVDGFDQMRRAGRFLWLDWAQASGKSTASKDQGPLDSFEGAHDGYRRLGVTHRRVVRRLSDSAWIIVDDLLGSGRHGLRLHWLAPDLPFQVFENPFRVAFASDREHFSFTMFSSCNSESALVRAGESSTTAIDRQDLALLGWESLTYGQRQPAVSLLCRTRDPLPVRFATVILAGESSQIERESGAIAIRDEHEQLCTISITPGGFVGAATLGS